MDICFDRAAMLAALNAVLPVVPTRSPKPVLQSVKLTARDDGASLLATDLELSICATVDSVAVTRPGSVLLPPGRFRQILQSSGDETLDLTADGSNLRISGLRSEYEFATDDAELFPEPPAFDAAAYLRVEAADLRRLIRRTIYATDVESRRFALGGCLVEREGETVALVGTDGRRLARCEAPCEAVGEPTLPGSPVLPVKALKLLDRLLDDDAVCVAIDGSSARFRTGGAVISTRLVEGRYPRYQDVFPKESPMRIDVRCGDLLAAYEQASIATSEESRGVDATFANDLLTLAGKAADVGRSKVELAIGHDGPPIEVTLDSRYLTDALKTLDADAPLTVELIDGKAAVVVRTEDGFTYVVMPMARDK